MLVLVVALSVALWSSRSPRVPQPRGRPTIRRIRRIRSRPRDDTVRRAAALLASAVPPVTDKSFGIHSYQTKPQIPARATRWSASLAGRTSTPARVCSSGTRWTTGSRRWRAFGFDDILFAFCGTPAWAAQPDIEWPGDHYYGYLSSAPPARTRDYVAYVRAVAKRYKGRITAYELWNEATSRFLWQGTPKQAAELTAAGASAIRRVDPNATIIGFNAQTYRADWLNAFFPLTSGI